jgi:hypothetical protein
MADAIELTGKRFGRWTVVQRAKANAKGARWSCRCDCGTERIVRSWNLRSGTSTSCGCLSAELGAAASRTKR